MLSAPVESKCCTKCRKWKPLEEFAKQTKARDGLQANCRGCMSVAYRQWLSAPENRGAQRRAHRRWLTQPENWARYTEAQGRYRRTLKGRAKKAEYMRRRRQTDPEFRLYQSLRSRVRQALKGLSKSARTLELLGCPIEELVKHLEAKFLPGMTWANHGEWHIDHILPISAFNLTDPEQQRKACHWSNLQPLWAVDNLRKGAKILDTCSPNGNGNAATVAPHGQLLQGTTE